MTSLRMRLVLIILSLLFPVPQSFVIRKRSVGYDFTNNKEFPSEWVLERPGDTLRDSYPARYGLDDERMALNLMLQHPEEDYDDMEGGEGEEEDEVDEEPEIEASAGMLLPPEKDMKEDDAKVVDKSELEDLFEKTSEKKEKKKVSETAKLNKELAQSELSKEDVERLLGGGPISEHRKVVTETKILVSASNGSSSPNYEGVRVVEVSEKDPQSGTRRHKQTQWLVGPGKNEAISKVESGSSPSEIVELGKGWLGDMLEEEEEEEEEEEKKKENGNGQVKRKVKRSENSDDLREDGGSSAAERDVELLKAYIRLQTEENEHLEKALNLAITTQVDDSDEYLGDEIRHLRMAVEDEEALETIRQAIKGKQQAEEGGGSDSDEEVLEGGNDEGALEADEDDEEMSKQLLKAKLKKFLIDSAVSDLSAAGLEDGAQEEEEEEEEENGEREAEEEQPPIDFPYGNVKVLNPFTRDSFDDFRQTKRSLTLEDILEDTVPASHDTNDLDITDLMSSPRSASGQVGMPHRSVCPAVQELTDDCVGATREGLLLDAEATDLCNRHQLCYYCGSVFGMSSDTCDRGYLGESELLCSGKEKCAQEAAGLFLVMLKSHQFNPSPEFTPYFCSASCVYDFIIGRADDRRR